MDFLFTIPTLGNGRSVGRSGVETFLGGMDGETDARGKRKNKEKKKRKEKCREEKTNGR